MKYLRLFEKFKDEPQFGDYVYCQLKKRVLPNRQRIDFIDDNVGQYRIINPNYPEISRNKYMIYYDNAPSEALISKRIAVSRNEILAFAPTIEELELKMKQIKYNI